MKLLWQRCFGDEESYIDHYFRQFFRPERGLVVEAEGKLCSMLLLFPFLLTAPSGEQHSASYIYAFCTLPEEQGKGYGRMLLAYAEKLALEQGCSATVMVPGEESLFRFYHSLGYETQGFLRERTEYPGCAHFVPVPCPAEEYAALREAWLTGSPHVSYDGETLRYQESLCLRSGGGFYRLEDGIAAVERLEDGILVKELLCSHPKEAAAALMELLHAPWARLRLPPTPDHPQEERPFAVVKWLSPHLTPDWHHGWLAFAFD